MAKIAINAMSVDGRPAGVGRYARTIVCSVAERDPDNEYVVLVNRDNRRFFEQPRRNMRLEEISGMSRVRALRLVMEEVSFPRLCREKGFDLFHGLASMNPRRLPCPNVMTIHDMTYFLFPELHMLSKQIYFRVRLPEAVRRADHVITVSFQSKADIVRLLPVSPEKVSVVYSGLDPRFHRVEDPERLDAVLRKYGIEGPFILSVGVLEPRKNIPGLVRAFSLVRKKDLGAGRLRLVIAGKKGWKLRGLKEVLDEVDCRSDVILAGYVEDEDLPALYSAARLFAYPSLYEGFGFPVLEAMACGTPVLTSASSSLKEIAGDAAVLVDPTRVEEIAEGIATGLDESRAKELAARGLRRAAEFTVERAADETIRVYHRLLGGA